MGQLIEADIIMRRKANEERYAMQLLQKNEATKRFELRLAEIKAEHDLNERRDRGRTRLMYLAIFVATALAIFAPWLL